MVKKQPENTTKFDLRGAIRFDCFNSNLSIRDIAKKFNVSKKTVLKWKHRDSIQDKVRERKKKVNMKQLAFIKKMAEGKFTGIDQASSRLIAEKVRDHFSTSENEFSISHSAVNKYLKDDLKLTARKVKKTFLLTKKNKESRVAFGKYIKENRIKGENIFFTDESRFLLETSLNPQTNQIRISKEDNKRLREGDPKVFEQIHTPIPKFSQGFMVAGGISMYGPGQLIFCVGTMDSKSYLKTLRYFKDDIIRMHPMLYFQQDNASCHTSKESMDFIRDHENFSHFLENWPANSPDLSPIETLWALLKEKVSKAKFQTLYQMKKELIKCWNRIPVKLCKKLVKSFDKKIEALGEKGERVNLPKPKKKAKTAKGNYKKASQPWISKWNDENEDEVDRVVFNNVTLKQNKDRALRMLKRKLKEELKRWKDLSKEVYSARIMNQVKKENWVNWSRLENKKKRDELTHKIVVKHFEDKIEETEAMDLEEWYSSLNRVVKLRMLKLNSLSKKDFECDEGMSVCETRVEEEEREEKEDSENNEEIEEENEESLV